MISTIKLSDIPDALLPVISSSGDSEKHLYLNGKAIAEVFIHRNQYRINTASGQYRYSLDTDVTIEIY